MLDDVVIGIVGYEKVLMPKKTASTVKFGVDTAENERGIPSFLLKMSVRKSRALGVSFFCQSDAGMALGCHGSRPPYFRVQPLPSTGEEEEGGVLLGN